MKKITHLITALLPLILLILVLSGCEDDSFNVPPASTVADFSYEVSNSGYAPCQVAFTNLSVNAEGFLWDLGNGQTSAENNPVVTYDEPGAFTVTLTCTPVNNVYYNQLTKTVTINIKDPFAGQTKVLYYTTRGPEGGSGYYVVLDGQEPPVIYNFTGTALSRPYGITVDTALQKVFISDYYDRKIYSYDSDGTNEQLLLDYAIPGQEIVDDPYGLLFIEGKLYWARNNGIGRCNPDGSNPELIFDFGGSAPELPLDLEYDPESKKIYIANDKYEFSGGLWTINLDGTGLAEVIPDLDPTALELDLVNGKIYIAAYGVAGTAVTENGIYICDMDGNNISKIGDFGDRATWGIAHDLEGNNLYWGYKISSSGLDGKIIRSNLDGSGQVDWITNISPHAMIITKIKL